MLPAAVRHLNALAVPVAEPGIPEVDSKGLLATDPRGLTLEDHDW